MKNNTKLKNVQRQIQEIKKNLLSIPSMRPGALTQQYNVCGKAACRCKHPTSPKRHGPYYQLSYTLKGKSTSRFVRPSQKKLVQEQLRAYKKFRQLINRWIILSIRQSELLVQDHYKSQDIT